MIRNFKNLNAVLMFLALMAMSGIASAQATRTWVSGVGDDANPCSRTAPCKTFAGAISKTAAKGMISVLDPGGFGTLTITKGITIDGGGINGSILSVSTNGIIINAGVNDSVRIRNISIDAASSGFDGIRFLAGKALLLDNVRIHDTTNGQGVNFIPSGSSRLVISDSIISNNVGGSGVYVAPGASGFAYVSIDNTRLNNNMYGLRAEARSMVSIRNSFVSNNTSNGITANSVTDPVEITVDSCQVTQNGINGSSAAGIKSNGVLASIVISENLISGNYNGLVASAGGDIFSFGSNRVVDNNVDGTPTGTLTTR
jgi:hypothetical protein